MAIEAVKLLAATEKKPEDPVKWDDNDRDASWSLDPAYTLRETCPDGTNNSTLPLNDTLDRS
ncbi:hypothetical protein M436DRAFT_86480 [Aureobasidium namibiae CBS 147.97]|uniref:Uncharacterized protein n=1 Tax=Aureobasidium namibiae CBS 147.97 TaxID=1043004 RepID=A0A074W645_9PEZI|nr:uncharacterized protein M436DRAFT_86480 [Aureobasidium namibiae CBS 147.97]KEQ68353.1 hypothetical protein M436DRAFT_86480 [Aureobasidium namibiae CBS 147.97]